MELGERRMVMQKRQEGKVMSKPMSWGRKEERREKPVEKWLKTHSREGLMALDPELSPVVKGQLST